MATRNQPRSLAKVSMMTRLCIPPTFCVTMILCVIMVPVSFGQTDRDQGEASDHDRLPHRIASVHLPNPVRIHPRVISGGLPSSDAAFGELAKLGVKTIISVDGAKPDLTAARKHGLRYVHLPHGYDGIPASRVNELAKAVRDLEAPIYLHCHHGKHRSPAAATAACVAAGLLPSTQAIAVLELAGTSKAYRGLYLSAKQARPLRQAYLDTLEVEFREVVEIPPIAEAMVLLAHTHDRLSRIADANWRAPSQHPDLAPAHEALLLREHFTEILRTPQSQAEPDEFQEMLRDSELAARLLEQSLRSWRPDSATADVPSEIPRLARRITDNCVACHAKFRDVPLSEK